MRGWLGWALAIGLSFVTWSFCRVERVQAQADDSGNAEASEEPVSEARALFMAGRVAYDEGRYEAALTHFNASYELSQRPELLYNMAQCYDRLRRDEEAIDAFERYLAAEPDPERRALVESRLRALRAARDSRQPAPPATDPIAPIETRDAPPADTGSVWLSAPVLTVGAGVALAVTGSIVMVLGNQHGNDVENAPVGSRLSTLESDLRAAETEWLVGQVVLGVGVAAIAGGLVWLMVDRKDDHDAVQVSITPMGVVAGGRF